jgi:hypothetical protein
MRLLGRTAPATVPGSFGQLGIARAPARIAENMDVLSIFLRLTSMLKRMTESLAGFVVDFALVVSTTTAPALESACGAVATVVSRDGDDALASD